MAVVALVIVKHSTFVVSSTGLVKTVCIFLWLSFYVGCGTLRCKTPCQHLWNFLLLCVNMLTSVFLSPSQVEIPGEAPCSRLPRFEATLLVFLVWRISAVAPFLESVDCRLLL